MIFSGTTEFVSRKNNRFVLKAVYLTVLLVAACRLPLTAYDITPYYNASLMGGQYFYETNAGALAGNASLLASASMKLSPVFTLIPIYSGRYQGAKQVADLAGGGTLFQALMDHKAAVKGVYS